MNKRCLVTIVCLALAATSITAGEISSEAVPLEAEARLCTAVEERLPVGEAAEFGAGIGTVFCWSKITGAADSTSITHLWLYSGKEMARVELPVKSPAWRTWSSKKILPMWSGNWEVRILDSGGQILRSVTFLIDGLESGNKPADTTKQVGS